MTQPLVNFDETFEEDKVVAKQLFKELISKLAPDAIIEMPAAFRDVEYRGSAILKGKPQKLFMFLKCQRSLVFDPKKNYERHEELRSYVAGLWTDYRNKVLLEMYNYIKQDEYKE